VTLTYRRAQPSDAAAIDQIRCASGEEITARLGQGHWSAVSNVAAVRQKMKARSVYLVLGEDGEAVATFAVSEKQPRFWPPTIWRIPEAPALGVFELSVLPTRQRQGIGTWIMRAVEELARAQGYHSVRLDTYEVNPRSAAFYRKLGYDERGKVVVGNTSLLCFERDVQL
jgi:GNAT superfamily N-acetyltransferase